MGEVQLMQASLAASANRLAENLALGLTAVSPAVRTAPLTISHAGHSLRVAGAASISPAQIAMLEQGLAAVTPAARPSVLSLNRLSALQTPEEPTEVPDVVGGAAFAVDPKIVFADARKRITPIYVLNFVVTTIVTAILVGASTVFWFSPSWANWT